MVVAGIDIGAATAKAVLLNSKGILSKAIYQTGPDVVKIAKKVTESALTRANLNWDDLGYVLATGYGRISVSFANSSLTEISCHARGAKWLSPEVEMVIDIGGQDSKAIVVSPKGGVSDFVMNDKCAAGTGRFLEVMANVLEMSLEDFCTLALKSRSPCQISSVCTIFAESEVISLRAQRKPIEDIVAGIHKASAKRVCTMASRLGKYRNIVFTGGVAKNKGMIKALENELGVTPIIPEEPQLVGALGAALLAREMAGKTASAANR
ncbi:MAG: acyl-CoA dehydratase activase [Syntrophobacteraceae bacterium]